MATILDPINQTVALIFSDVPSHYTSEHIILNHFTKHNKNKANKSISATAWNRWLRIIRKIVFKPNNKCEVIFSSIFYWCKYSRILLHPSSQNNSGIKVSSHPSYYPTIRRVFNIDFAVSNANNKLLKLYSIPQSIVSYTFIQNKNLYITTKLQSLQEILIQIPISNVSHIGINAPNNNQKQSEMRLSLANNCEIYEYYHRHKLWKCVCGNVNKILNNNTESDHKMICGCCGDMIDRNNSFHFHQICVFSLRNDTMTNLKSISKNICLTQQRHFYRKMSSFNTETKMFDLLSPLFTVLNEQKRDIATCIMFTNAITFKYNNDSDTLRHYLKGNINIEAKMLNNDIKYTQMDFGALYKSVDSTLKWLSLKPALIFPILSRLFDFQNPGALCANVEEYFSNKIEELLDGGTTQWIIKEAIMGVDDTDSEELENKIDFLEEKYENEGIFGVDNEDSKGPFVYELQLLPFSIQIKEADLKVLNASEDWKKMNSVGSQIDNYVIAFEHRSHSSGVYDAFERLVQRMQINSFSLIDGGRCEIMHWLAYRNEKFALYGATILNGHFSDENFIEYFKKDMALTEDMKSNFEECDDDIIDSKQIYCIEPPIKKMKTNDLVPHKQISLKQEWGNNQIKTENMKDIQMKMNDRELRLIPKRHSSVKQTFKSSDHKSKESEMNEKQVRLIPKKRITVSKPFSNQPKDIEMNEKQVRLIRKKPISVTKNDSTPNDIEMNESVSILKMNKESNVMESIDNIPPQSKDIPMKDGTPKNKIVSESRKRKRKQFDQSIKHSLDDSDSDSDSATPIPQSFNFKKRVPAQPMAMGLPQSFSAKKQIPMSIPKSFTKREKLSFKPISPPKPPKPPKPLLNSEPLSSHSESYDSEDSSHSTEICADDIAALTVIDGVGWAYDVPVYNQWYWHCANFTLDMRHFAEMVITFACRTALIRYKELRNKGTGNRTRKLSFPDAADPQFIKTVDDPVYLRLFEECFTREKGEERMKIDLLAWNRKLKRKKRRKKFVIYNYKYGIREHMKCRLFLLLKLAAKHSALGCIAEQRPPWLCGDIVDLTLDDGCDSTEYGEMEKELCEDEYESESD